jgi:hypothetical protein
MLPMPAIKMRDAIKPPRIRYMCRIFR